MTRRQKQRWAGIVGTAGALLLVVAVAGSIARTFGTTRHAVSASTAAEEISAGVQSLPPQPEPQAADTATPRTAPETSPEASDREAGRGSAHYPLAVGRYWVYRYHDSGSDVVTQIERLIIRREARRDASDLYFFDDGMIAYYEDGKVFEMGSNGGVNIIPVDLGSKEQRRVMYRSQGLQIEKWLAAGDTSIVIDGHRFERCLEVVTRFRRLDEVDADGVSYSSFYAPGIGLVGRQQWPPDSVGTLAVTLSAYGIRQLPSSTAAGQL